MVCPHLTRVHSGERKRLPWVRDKFYLVHGSGVIFNVSVLGYFFIDVLCLGEGWFYTCARGWMKDWKGFGTSRDPNIPSLFIQHSSLSKYLALPTRAILHVVGYRIVGQLWGEEGSAVI